MTALDERPGTAGLFDDPAKNLRGVLFDFNGVLLWDSPLHEQAWNDCAARWRGRPFSAEEMALHVQGRTNGAILTYLFGHALDAGDEARRAEEKEEQYRAMCLRQNGAFRLSPGAETLLNTLAARRVPFTIATSSDARNVDFYFAHLPLARWFERSRVAYFDGALRGKPAPDLYLRAAGLLRLPPADCAVVEDSYSGIQAARAAQVGGIIALGPRAAHPALAALPGVTAVIEQLDQFPAEMLVNEGMGDGPSGEPGC
jgi:HAD superfamily hydrolase (TIGR01509 family)